MSFLSIFAISIMAVGLLVGARHGERDYTMFIAATNLILIEISLRLKKPEKEKK